MSLIVSIKEARKLLGKKLSDKMDDQEIEKLIMDLDEIARLTIKGILDGTLKVPQKNSKMKE